MDHKKSTRRRLLHRVVVKLGGKKLLSKKFRGKKCGIFVKDIYGTRPFWDRDQLLKTSSLYQEMIMRIEMYAIRAEYNHLKSVGMLQWPSYKEEVATIDRLLQMLNGWLDARKSRRLKTRLFYLCPPPKNACAHILLRIPLYYMPLEQALKRRRLDIKRERKILAAYNKRAANAASCRVADDSVLNQVKITLQKVCTKSLGLYMTASIFLGCIIVLIP